MPAERFPAIALALTHLPVAEGRHGEVSFRSGRPRRSPATTSSAQYLEPQREFRFRVRPPSVSFRLPRCPLRTQCRKCRWARGGQGTTHKQPKSRVSPTLRLAGKALTNRRPPQPTARNHNPTLRLAGKALTNRRPPQPTARNHNPKAPGSSPG